MKHTFASIVERNFIQLKIWLPICVNDILTELMAESINFMKVVSERLMSVFIVGKRQRVLLI